MHIFTEHANLFGSSHNLMEGEGEGEGGMVRREMQPRDHSLSVSVLPR